MYIEFLNHARVISICQTKKPQLAKPKYLIIGVLILNNMYGIIHKGIAGVLLYLKYILSVWDSAVILNCYWLQHYSLEVEKLFSY